MSAASTTALGARRREVSEPMVLATLGAIGAALLVYLGPPGTDFAAHAYQAALFSAHGFALWNNLWYSGRYSFVTYSTLYYPLASLIGIRALAVLCVAVAVAAFALVAERRWGDSARWSSRSAAVVLPAFVLSAAFPFLLGATLSLLAILSLQARRWPAFAVLCVLAAAASPLAFLFLALVVIAVGLGDRWSRRHLLIAASMLGFVVAVLVLLAALFPSGARYPFPMQAFLPAMAFAAALAALTWRLEAARSLRFIALLDAAACVAALLVSSEVGEAVTRLRFVALPLMLLALALRRWRPRGLSILAMIVSAYWNVAPLVTSFANGVGDPSQHVAFWQPATGFLRANLSPGYRVEVVDTQRHWAAAYLPAAGIPLVRGWFRQDDFPQNAPLYHRLGPAAYRRWLRGLGVRFVVLTDVTPDYSAQREAALLRSGHSGLRPVLRTRHVVVFSVPRPRPIVTGPGRPRVTALTREQLDLRAGRPGTYRVAVRFSPYWRASAGCLSPGRDGMMALRVWRPGPVRLSFSVGSAALLQVLVGVRPRCAPTG